MVYTIIAYDISDDKDRIDTLNFLKKYFNHIQKSVFEGYINNKDFRFVIKELSRRIYYGDKLIIILLKYKNFKRIRLGKREDYNII